MNENADKTVQLSCQEQAPAPGRTVAHFRLLEPLGRGGMGVVYKAEDVKLNRVVALKFLTPALTGDPEAKERFIREAQAASALDHNNICTIFEVGETQGGTLFIAMAYYEGATVRQRLEERPLAVGDALAIALQVSRGLAKAHENGIIHRDIKPENVILTRDGSAKIVDFGLAKLAGRTGLTKTGATAGTLSYMSPEQVRGEVVDSRTDVWSLGVMLYEMLAGRRPFAADNSAAVIQRILHEKLPALSTVRQDVSKSLSAVVERATDKDRSRRHPSARELADDLAAVAAASEPATLRVRARPRLSHLLEHRSVRRAAIAVAVLVAAVAAALHPWSRAPVAPAQRSIAVLPFRDVSQQKGGDYFATGVTAEINARLSRLRDLRVISQTSAARYKDSAKPSSAIGSELGVAYLLVGTVGREGRSVTVVSELLEAQSGKRVWHDTFKGDLSGIFAIRASVAERVADALGVAHPEGRVREVRAEPTADLDAYDVYLRGMDYYNRRRKADNEQAIALFDKAVERDPGFARAYAALGAAYAQQYYYESGAGARLASSISMSERALALDPDLAEAHRALGLAYFYKGWATRAIDSYYLAIKDDPNYAAAMASLGVALDYVGQLREGLEFQKRAAVLDPTNVALYAYVGDTLLDLTEDEQAERWYLKALDLQPNLGQAHAGIVQLRLFQGRPDEALKEVERMLAVAAEDPTTGWYAGFVHLVRGEYRAAEPFLERSGNAAGLAIVYAKTGRAGEAKEFLEDSIAGQKSGLSEGYELYPIAYTLAQLYAVQGMKDEAYTWLESAIKWGFRRYRLCRVDPTLAALHGEARYNGLMKQIETDVQRMKREAAGAVEGRGRS